MSVSPVIAALHGPPEEDPAAVAHADVGAVVAVLSGPAAHTHKFVQLHDSFANGVKSNKIQTNFIPADPDLLPHTPQGCVQVPPPTPPELLLLQLLLVLRRRRDEEEEGGGGGEEAEAEGFPEL